jgi:MtN3 and saliva related transmembrane protein
MSLIKYGELNPEMVKSKRDEKNPPPELPFHVYAVGVAAGALTCIAFLPQVWKAVATRTPSQLTWLTLMLCVIGQTLWTVYGGLTQDKILLIFSLISLILYLCLVASKTLPFFKSRVN